MELTFLLLTVFLGFLALMVFIVIPFALLVSCALSSRIQGVGKVIWILLMIFIPIFTNYFYGLFASDRRGIKILSGVSVFVLLFLLSSFLYVGKKMENMKWEDSQTFLSQIEKNFFKMPALPRFQKMGVDDASHLMEKFEKTNKTGISQSQRDSIQLGLLTLQLELQQKDLESQRKKVFAKILELLELYLSDGTFTQGEYHQWMNHFKSRKTLEPKTLSAQIRAYKKSQ